MRRAGPVESGLVFGLSACVLAHLKHLKGGRLRPSPSGKLLQPSPRATSAGACDNRGGHDMGFATGQAATRRIDPGLGASFSSRGVRAHTDLLGDTPLPLLPFLAWDPDVTRTQAESESCGL
ncbi:hypothetical protein NDU88_001051 [Pleurodeles waltl]|uniref:Uncharacterized protein n=1 Tax=Pleurodeles waltl TaxID=8319 RepID=A0AAV7P2P9_PLEWA|nr:hypothetical protein NDU88_001051 [Pleurodeles waltl]